MSSTHIPKDILIDSSPSPPIKLQVIVSHPESAPLSSVGLTYCSLTPPHPHCSLLFFIPLSRSNCGTHPGSTSSLPAKWQGPTSPSHSRPYFALLFVLLCHPWGLSPLERPSHPPPSLLPGSTSEEGDHYCAVWLLTFLPSCPVHHRNYLVPAPLSGTPRSMVRSAKVSNLFSRCHQSEFSKTLM